MNTRNLSSTAPCGNARSYGNGMLLASLLLSSNFAALPLVVLFRLRFPLLLISCIISAVLLIASLILLRTLRRQRKLPQVHAYLLGVAASVTCTSMFFFALLVDFCLNILVYHASTFYTPSLVEFLDANAYGIPAIISYWAGLWLLIASIIAFAGGIWGLTDSDVETYRRVSVLTNKLLPFVFAAFVIASVFFFMFGTILDGLWYLELCLLGLGFWLLVSSGLPRLAEKLRLERSPIDDVSV